MKVDVQAIPARGAWKDHLAAFVAAEEAGFTTAWVVDHLSGRPFGGPSMLECFTQLGALAAATTTIGLGPLVVNVTTRNPGLLGVAAASVQEISGGRLVLGLGAGASPTSPFADEQHAVANPVAARLEDRHDRLLAALDLLRRQWNAAPGEPFGGFPRPDPVPPILIGVNSRRLARIAGEQTNGINVRYNHPRRREILATARDAHADRTGWWTLSVWAPWGEGLTDEDHPLRRELAGEGVDRLVLMWVEPPSPAAVARAGARLSDPNRPH